MSALQGWIVLLALVSALAGFAAGRLTAPVGEAPAERAFAAYAERLAAEFELEPDRVRALEILLERFERDIEALKIRNLTQHQPELVRLGDTYRNWIRDKVLPPERRADFDAMVAASTASLID